MNSDLGVWVGVGAALGFITSMPIGPINMTFAAMTARGRKRESLALAVAVGILDGGCAFVALSATSPDRIRLSPSPLLELVACALLVGYGASLLIPRAMSAEGSVGWPQLRGVLTGAAVGIALYLLNPAFAAFWLGAALVLQAKFPAIVSPMGRVCFALGVNMGVDLWFATVNALLRRHPLPWPIVRRMAQGTGLLLIGLGAYLMAKRL
jgi:threonine/homoserine/homoserine lactone efflux protein